MRKVLNPLLHCFCFNSGQINVLLKLQGFAERRNRLTLLPLTCAPESSPIICREKGVSSNG
jgi:hypothetical protein